MGLVQGRIMEGLINWKRLITHLVAYLGQKMGLGQQENENERALLERAS
jgi:hypothetical protein